MTLKIDQNSISWAYSAVVSHKFIANHLILNSPQSKKEQRLETQNWQAHILQLLYRKKYTEAQKELENCWQEPFNSDMNLLMNVASEFRPHSYADTPEKEWEPLENFCSKELIPFILNRKELRKLFLNEGNWKNLSQQNKMVAARCMVPEFFQYICRGRVLAPKGIKIIADYLSNKQIPALPDSKYISICPDYRSFEKILKQLEADDGSTLNGYCHYFIVSNALENPAYEARHVIPVFCKKIDGKWLFVITDSTPKRVCDLRKKQCDCSQSHCNPLAQSIQQVFKDQISVIDIATYRRQTDTESCPIFALKDLCRLYKSNGELIKRESLERDQGIKYSRRVNYFWRDDFPPEFMKMTQSFVEINQYGSLLSKEKGSSFLLSVKKHIKKIDFGNENYRNYLAQERGEKYIGIILDSIYKEYLNSRLEPEIV